MPGYNRTKMTNWLHRTFKTDQSTHRVTPGTSRRPAANQDTQHWFTKPFNGSASEKKALIRCSLFNEEIRWLLPRGNSQWLSRITVFANNFGGVKNSQRSTEGASDTISENVDLVFWMTSDLKYLYLADPQVTDPPGRNLQLHHSHLGHTGSAKVEMSGSDLSHGGGGSGRSVDPERLRSNNNG